MGKHCEAVELLLARMDSNPEEFTEYGRWEKHIVKYRPHLPMEDQMALTDKINALRLDTFHKDVMKELLAEPNDETEKYVWNAGTRPGAMPISTPVNGVSNNHYAQMQNTYLAGLQASPSTLTNVGAGSALTTTSSNINLSQNSIQELARQLQSYAANTWKKP